ncbi:MAG: hypothetical protein R3A51_04910 [Nannocystaceae bacterium]|nr:hypothetical protein [Myxococcales bacterium]
MLDPDLSFQLAPYLPSFDPEHFAEPAFYRELEKIGYRQLLIGGTGCGNLADTVRMIKRESGLTVVQYPAGPASIAPADLILLPDVMNSNSHYARPFGSGSVATAMNIAKMGLKYLPIAYFIMGNSTAGWFHDSFLLPSAKILIGYATYARMVGYRHLALDYEDPKIDIDPQLIARLGQIPGIHITISDEFDPASARRALELGANTIISPSDIFEDASDPLALAAEFYDALLKPR